MLVVRSFVDIDHKTWVIQLDKNWNDTAIRPYVLKWVRHPDGWYKEILNESPPFQCDDHNKAVRFITLFKHILIRKAERRAK